MEIQIQTFQVLLQQCLQVFSHQKQMMSVRILGNAHHLSESQSQYCISFKQAIVACRKPLSSGKTRIFHARRIDEIIQALCLKYLFGAKFKIVFSSAAQRYRSKVSYWLIRRVNAVIAMCKASTRYIEKQPVPVIYHGVDVERYQPAQDKQLKWQQLTFDNKVKPNKYGIAILGRVRQQKGVHLFVDACIKCLQKEPDYTAVIVGAISKDNEEFVIQLQEKIAKAGLAERIVFVGEQEYRQIPDIFSALSLVVALSDNEGFGLTPLEAMSSGTAVFNYGCRSMA